MELTLLSIGLFLLLANSIILLWLVLKDPDGSLTPLLNNLRDGQLNQERLFRDEIGRSRVESAGIAREHRLEIGTSFQSLSDMVFGRMAEFGQSQTAKLDAFSGQLRDTSEEMGRKLDF